MAYSTGVLSVRGGLYDFTGQTNYTSGGTEVGKIVDILQFQFGREIKVYSRWDQGDTPFYARIVGELVRVTVQIADYNANWVNLISQRRPKTGATGNFHFGAGATYTQGNILTTSNLTPIMIKDQTTPGDYPALYLPATLTENVSLVRMMQGSRMVDMAEITLLGLHSDTFGSIGAFGDLSQFPVLS